MGLRQVLTMRFLTANGMNSAVCFEAEFPHRAIFVKGYGSRFN